MADSKNRTKVLSYPMLSVFLDEIKKIFAGKTHKHVANEITEDTTHKFVTDVEKDNWNDKTSVSIVRWS